MWLSGLQDLLTKLSVSELSLYGGLFLLGRRGRLVRVRGGAKRVYHLDRESTLSEKARRKQ